MSQQREAKKLRFEPQDIYVESAKLRGKPMEPFEEYFRDNNGDWIVGIVDGGRFCAVTFQGKAKRGQTYNAPDPEGFENAQRLTLAWNAHDAMVEALEACERHLSKCDQNDNELLDKARAALALAKGEK